MWYALALASCISPLCSHHYSTGCPPALPTHRIASLFGVLSILFPLPSDTQMFSQITHFFPSPLCSDSTFLGSLLRPTTLTCSTIAAVSCPYPFPFHPLVFMFFFITLFATLHMHVFIGFLICLLHENIHSTRVRTPFC